jgi:hypothetical protein
LFVLTRRSVPHIDMGTEPPLAHIGAVNPSSDARGNFQTTFAAFRTVFNALCRETNADPGAPRVGPPHRREEREAAARSLRLNLCQADADAAAPPNSREDIASRARESGSHWTLRWRKAAKT